MLLDRTIARGEGQQTCDPIEYLSGVPLLTKNRREYRHNIEGNVQSGLHYDTYFNSLTVLSGSKTVFLFPPTESDYMYMIGDVAKSESELRARCSVITVLGTIWHLRRNR
jgi:hypothetical protein